MSLVPKEWGDATMDVHISDYQDTDIRKFHSRFNNTLYLVTADGRVWNTNTEVWVTQTIRPTDIRVDLGRPYQLHRLLAVLFVPNPDRRKWAVPIDGSRFNCVSSNFIWSSYQSYVLGKQHGKLTITDEVTHSGHRYKVRALCECGISIDVRLKSLVNGDTTSCGCYARKVATLHGMSTHPLYIVLKGMLHRCNSEGHKSYMDYGGRGITVCPKWTLTNPMVFISWAESNGYKKGLEIDRIDNDGNYEPSNCRWVTHQVNMNNTRNTIINKRS